MGSEMRHAQMLVFMLPMEDDEEAGSFRGRRSHPSHDVAASILETSRPIQQSLVGARLLSPHSRCRYPHGLHTKEDWHDFGRESCASSESFYRVCLYPARPPGLLLSQQAKGKLRADSRLAEAICRGGEDGEGSSI